MSYSTQGTNKSGVALGKEAEKRREVGVSLRDRKNAAALRSKREKHDADDGAPEPGMGDMCALSRDDIPMLAEKLYGSDEDKLMATGKIRRMLSQEAHPPIDDVVSYNNGIFVPSFIQFLDRHDMSWLQFEAAWALTNIASGTAEHTKLVIPAIPKFISLLSSTSCDVCEQSIWALGNIAGDSAKARDIILSHDILSPLLRLVHFAQSDPSAYGDKTKRILRTATWCLSNLFRGKPVPNLQRTQGALQAIAQLIHYHDPPKEDVLIDALWALSFASDGPNDMIQAVLDLKVLPRVVELLSDPEPKILSPSLRIVGNIVTGNDPQTNEVLACGVLEKFRILLSKEARTMRKECCWALSNITAGTPAQCALVVEAGLVKHLVHNLKSGEFEVKKEALWAISNLTNSSEHIPVTVEEGAIQGIVDILNAGDYAIAKPAFEGLENIFEHGKQVYEREGRENLYKIMFVESGGEDQLYKLQSTRNVELYNLAYDFLVKNFDTEVIEEDAAGYEYGPSGQPATQPSSPYDGLGGGAAAGGQFNF